MDWTSVLVAGCALAGTLGGSALGIKQSNKVVDLRLSQLEKKVDKHNNLVERMTSIEGEIKEHNRRLEEIEDVLPRAAGK